MGVADMDVKIEVFQGISRDRLAELLFKMKRARVAMLGDICLDVYWRADMTKSELSRETPHFPLPVMEERFSPGAGGNVAANLAALEPAKVWAVSAIGEDWRGTELLKALCGMGVDTGHVIHARGMTTNAYCKPIRTGISKTAYEDPRLDFANYKPLDASVEDAVIASLNALAPSIDALCVSDQLRFGVVTERVRGHVAKLARDGLCVVVDSRDRIALYTDAILKPNELEAANAVASIECAKSTDSAGNAERTGSDKHATNAAGSIKRTENAWRPANMANAAYPGNPVNAGFSESLARLAETALKLSCGSNCETLMTIGQKGSLYAAGGNVTHIPANYVPGETDIVGAGDTFLSGFSLALAAGATRLEAAFVAGLCSEVTIRQIGITGVATPAQIIERYIRL